jgi:hypothetical protein
MNSLPRPHHGGRTVIKIRYSAVDGFNKLKSFKTLKGARKYAQEMVGKYPSFGSYYAVSDDGVGKIEVIEGVKLRDLFGDEGGDELKMMSDDEAMEAAFEAFQLAQQERVMAEENKVLRAYRLAGCSCSEQQLNLVGCDCAACRN